MNNLYRVRYEVDKFHCFTTYDEAEQCYVELVEEGNLFASVEVLSDDGWLKVNVDRVLKDILEDEAFKTFVELRAL